MLWLPKTAAVVQSASQAWDTTLTEDLAVTGMQSLFTFGSVDAATSAVHLVPSEWKPLTLTAVFVGSTTSGQPARHSMLRPTDLPTTTVVHAAFVAVLSATQTPASTWQTLSKGSAVQSVSSLHGAPGAGVGATSTVHTPLTS